MRAIYLNNDGSTRVEKPVFDGPGKVRRYVVGYRGHCDLARVMEGEAMTVATQAFETVEYRLVAETEAFFVYAEI